MLLVYIFETDRAEKNMLKIKESRVNKQKLKSK